jgi:hypothetical protein
MNGLRERRLVGAVFIAVVVVVWLLASTEGFAAKSGSRIWVHRYDLAPGLITEFPMQSVLARDGSLCIAGTRMLSATSSHPYVVKYSRRGAKRWIWTQQILNYPMAYVADAGVDKHGNVYTCGTLKFTDTDFDLLLIKQSPAGDVIWIRVWGAAQRREAANAMVVSPGGAVWIAGAAEDAAGQDSDYLLMRWNAAGSLTWSYTYDASWGNDDVATDVAFDGAGGIAFTGATTNNDGDTDCVTLRRTTKATGWKWYPARLYAGGAGGDEQAPRLAAGPGGTLFLALESHAGPMRGTDIVVIKYDRDHRRRWTRRYDGPDHRDEQLAALATDRYGSAYIAGRAGRTSAPGDSALAMRYTGGGKRTWTRLYRQRGQGRNAHYTDVAVDGSGRPYFGGTLQGGAGGDVLLAAYTRTGKLRWRRIYDSKDRLSDGVASLETFGTATLYVTGYSEVSPFDYRGLVMKYRQ